MTERLKNRDSDLKNENSSSRLLEYRNILGALLLATFIFLMVLIGFVENHDFQIDYATAVLLSNKNSENGIFGVV